MARAMDMARTKVDYSVQPLRLRRVQGSVNARFREVVLVNVLGRDLV
jgi:hypothetical protein